MTEFVEQQDSEFVSCVNDLANALATNSYSEQ